MKTEQIINYLYVATGGAIGSVLRVYLGSLIPMALYQDRLPVSILSINIIGCFLMGLISEILGVHYSASYNLRLFLISGLLGGFTTFSAFSLEFGLLWQKNLHGLAVVYCALSVLLSIFAFFAGIKLVKLM